MMSSLSSAFLTAITRTRSLFSFSIEKLLPSEPACLVVVNAIKGWLSRSGCQSPLALLDHSLQAVGAPALTAPQRESIMALFKSFREDHQPQPDAAVRNARASYEKAILSGNSDAAAAQAQVLANAQVADIAKREKATAVLAANLLAVLQTEPAQINALKATLQDSGLARLLIQIAGHPGMGPEGGRGAGPGGRGFGPMGRGPSGPFGHGGPEVN
jgi:hypothetical protein